MTSVILIIWLGDPIPPELYSDYPVIEAPTEIVLCVDRPDVAECGSARE